MIEGCGACIDIIVKMSNKMVYSVHLQYSTCTVQCTCKCVFFKAVIFREKRFGELNAYNTIT